MNPPTPSSPDTDSAEIARRLRAAMAYCGKTREQIAELLGIGERTVSRCMSESEADRGTTLSIAAQWYLSERLGISRAWWSADFDRLSEIVPPGRPTVPDASRSRVEVDMEAAGRDFRRSPAAPSQTGDATQTPEEAP